MSTACDYYKSPVGVLKICSDARAITEISVLKNGVVTEISNGDSLTEEAIRQLSEYFDGVRTSFDLPISPQGTDFQKEIWRILTKIPYGSALTYSDVARLSGHPKACRAVGNAVGKNPILIVIPCHRVKAVNGIGGFSAGIEMKKYLIRKENIAI